jgi:hypothetical protein
LDCCIAFKTEMNEIVVLGNDVSSRTREVEGICFLDTSKIMEFKFEMSGKFLLISPDNPSYTRIHKPVFMSGTIMRKVLEMGGTH